MATNLALDDRLITRVVKAGQHPTKRDAVNAALDEYVKHQRQQRILELVGSVDFWPDWDYKANRKLDMKRITLD